MKNLKIRVNSADESKEIQNILESIGFRKWDAWSESGSIGGFIWTDSDMTYCDNKMECFDESPRKEITLPELRAMVHQEQDEPFLTPECTLNDQYAEIERVRQGGLKFDNGKPRHSLLPKGSISSIIAVLEFGAKKYEANNWQKVDNAKERYYDAAMRHIDSWWNGEKFDQETGIHHLAHAATNLFFLKWFDDKENNNG